MVERETFPVDVLVVGAGPAGLSFAVQLGRELQAKGAEKSIMVLDKAGEFGQHTLSGAVLDPRSILELFPHAKSEGFPIEVEVEKDALWWLSEKKKRDFKGVFLPPPFKNEGKWIVSASKMVEWLAQQAEAFENVDVYPGTAAASILRDENGKVTGVRTADMGMGADGKPKANYEPGMDITADLVVFAEGTRGSLAKELLGTAPGLGKNPQIWGVGVKEVWEVEHQLLGTVLHTGGWPLPRACYGGGWIYGLPDNKLSIGFVVGMDHGDASFDYHAAMQKWKTHPALSELLKGGKLQSYGAKTVPEGGLHSMPPLFGDGFLHIGDSAGFLNAQRLKGLHLAVKSGALAASAASLALSENDYSADSLRRFDQQFQESWAYQELYEVRNFRAGFQKGFLKGFWGAAIGALSKGKSPSDVVACQSDHERYSSKKQVALSPPIQGGGLTFDKLTSVYHSGSTHEEEQPCHLLVADSRICVERCAAEYQNPCQNFCPASVYEWEGDSGLRINFSNCVHCKTCDIADPYQNIQWVVPESGGPIYSGM
ncbi:MAG: electron transfer flavoprotein-ubiquinone oxidoreductase [Planctomycetes bacterium]|jgi:electron-transferring-flavoprotein dehydrogenase|nr:electron transfer flavoprotein-ubiquinone oxidoreductase [Planctomycetota bacterium]MDP7246456.1 electron transfer flavoprotein-ubiquinone oxidoreductase [Planctomycetota bacterium]|tara:strand:- start:3139 stop:4761 length:1623 start_codon:yes stop_codon:yes gene_type:complete